MASHCRNDERFCAPRFEEFSNDPVYCRNSGDSPTTCCHGDTAASKGLFRRENPAKSLEKTLFEAFCSGPREFLADHVQFRDMDVPEETG
jgi:hypothetical protein